MSVRWKPGEGRVERIEHYESIYQQMQDALADMEKAFRTWADLQPQMAELENYYTGPFWKQDYAADEAGELPAELKRGILSEDGIYNLISDNERWLGALKEEVAQREQEEKWYQENQQLQRGGLI